MTKFSNKFKKPYSGPVFGLFSPFFGQKKYFQKSALSRIIRHGPLTPCRVSEKTNEPIPRKLLDRRTEGRKDGQTLIHRTLLAMAGGPKSDFFEQWQNQKQLQTMEMSEVWLDIYDEEYIHQFQPKFTSSSRSTEFKDIFPWNIS